MIEPKEARHLMFKNIKKRVCEKIKEASENGQDKVVIQEANKNATEKGMKLFIKFMQGKGYEVRYNEPNLHISWA